MRAVKSGEPRTAGIGESRTHAGEPAASDRPRAEEGEEKSPPELSAWERVGARLFRTRSGAPVALVLLVLLWPTPSGMPHERLALGTVLVLAGAGLRFWGVGTAGKRTRTRGSRVKELVTSGPFAHVRNPLYLANFVLTYGLVVLSRIGWLLWAFPVLFFFQYAAIVSWEERILLSGFGRSYQEYRSRVRRWIPSRAAYTNRTGHRFSARIARQSERGTLTAVGVLYCLLIGKHLFFHEQLARFFAGLR